MRPVAEVVVERNALALDRHQDDLAQVIAQLARNGIDAAAVVEEVSRFSVAAPSWALGTGGTRFGRFPRGGEPRTTQEKLDDIAALNTLTGANRSVSLHVPWDEPDDPAALREYAASLHLAFDAMNSNTFQDNPSTTADGKISYKFGSLSHTDPAVRRTAVQHNLSVIDLGRKLGSRAITIWLPDGSNHPGQASFRGQFERVLSCLKDVYAELPPDWRMFTEHKPYEPAFYSSVVADWGSSLMLAQATGERALCLVDLGHHLPGTNIEQIVSRLAMAGRLGGFHFNDSKYGDDDLTAGSIQPYQLFLVVLELLEAGGRQDAGCFGRMPELAYMIDQSNNLKDPIEDLLQSTDALQLALAQALCVNRDVLEEAREANDPALAEEVLRRAFRTDVRPLVAEARRVNGAALDPLGAFRASGYREAMLQRRGRGATATGL
jgi:L-rhamnose isomerase/sugar isomerase